MRLLRLIGPAVLGCLLCSSVHAQQQIERSFSTQLFEPAIGLDTYFAVEGPRVANHLAFGLGLMLNYQRLPFVLYRDSQQGVISGGFNIDDAEQLDVVENQLTANLIGALGLHYKWLHAQVGLDLPVNLLLSGSDFNIDGEPAGDLSATNIGDLRLQLKAMLLRDLYGFSLAFSPIITFPTGNDENFGGSANVTFSPRAVAGYSRDKFSVAATLGWLVRENSLVFSSEITDQLLYGIGAGYQVHDRVVLLAELSGRASFSSKSDCTRNPITGETECAGTSANDIDGNPLEADVGGRVRVMHGLDLTAGAGFGLVKAIGSPQFRVLAGLRWAPDFTDTDGDGLEDYRDQCPTQPEDMDGFQDADGCPDPDNDGDLIPDVRDKCPDEPEDKDGFQDEDGCPDLDNDGDKIPDIQDSCPFQPETFNGFKDEDGCPDVPDRDEDGIPDAQDKCPDEPEDMDGFQDLDGCPDPDNDNDGVPDQFDDCPLEAEDMDGFQDEDGCPDPDNDGDGVPDAQDKCPDQPETINGYKDDDGCPDRGQSQVIIKENKIVITKKVYFATNRATIKRISYNILNQVALTLKANPQIRGVRIEGHTDSRGNYKHNKDLSQARSEAVKAYLIGKGIEPGRLFAVGYGPDKPVADNRTGKGREQNRRVEFHILEQAPAEGGQQDPAEPAEDQQAPVDPEPAP